MNNKTIAKITVDLVILLCSVFLLAHNLVWKSAAAWQPAVFVLLVMIAVIAGMDIFRQLKKKQTNHMEIDTEHHAEIRQLILLDEQDKPVKSWDMAGKTALIIGKKGKDEEVDVDLEDCEYSSFIDTQHAALNFCLDSWYLEDLGSQNGVKIKKVEDGVCYKVLNRPCKVSAGDVIHIALTRLLLT